MGHRPARLRAAPLRGMLAVLAPALLGLAPATAAASPVPCTPRSDAKFNCTFWPAGDGIHRGAPVLDGIGRRVGYLNQGRNWIVCQRSGSLARSGNYYNVWWAYTTANDGRRGWVNAVWAHGGTNDGRYRGVPICARVVGYPPGGTPVLRQPPPPPPPPPGPTLRQRADRIMQLSYSAFIDFKQRVHPARFDWSTDGCSIPGRGLPGWVGSVVKSVSKLFNRPCQLHDFGYRNYGHHGLRLSPTERTRAWIDGRFHHEMDELCNHSFSHWWQWANKHTCLNEDGLMYKAVRLSGSSAF